MLLKILDLFYIFFYILKVNVLKFLVFVQKTCILEVFKNKFGDPINWKICLIRWVRVNFILLMMMYNNKYITVTLFYNLLSFSEQTSLLDIEGIIFMSSLATIIGENLVWSVIINIRVFRTVHVWKFWSIKMIK